jgi:hypothetical protein
VYYCRSETIWQGFGFQVDLELVVVALKAVPKDDEFENVFFSALFLFSPRHLYQHSSIYLHLLYCIIYPSRLASA